MTALVRLGMCDLFIHGTGGANYDRAMERWIGDWLGVQVGSVAVVSANLRLPLEFDGGAPRDAKRAQTHARHLWHDPESAEGSNPSRVKQTMLEEINREPRNSAGRKAAFIAMHERLDEMRAMKHEVIEKARLEAELAQRQAAAFEISSRRDWAFPLYPAEMIEQLKHEVTEQMARV